VDTWNSIKGASIPYEPTGAYGVSRFENGDWGYDGTSYDGDKVQMHVLVRYALDYGAP